MPEHAINSHSIACDIRNGIHTHTTGYQWYVVNNRRQHANNSVNQIIISCKGFVQSLAHGGQHTDFLEHGYCHQDAQKEHDGRKVYL